MEINKEILIYSFILLINLFIIFSIINKSNKVKKKNIKKIFIKIKKTFLFIFIIFFLLISYKLGGLLIKEYLYENNELSKEIVNKEMKTLDNKYKELSKLIKNNEKIKSEKEINKTILKEKNKLEEIEKEIKKEYIKNKKDNYYNKRLIELKNNYNCKNKEEYPQDTKYIVSTLSMNSNYNEYKNKTINFTNINITEKGNIILVIDATSVYEDFLVNIEKVEKSKLLNILIVKSFEDINLDIVGIKNDKIINLKDYCHQEFFPYQLSIENTEYQELYYSDVLAKAFIESFYEKNLFMYLKQDGIRGDIIIGKDIKIDKKNKEAIVDYLIEYKKRYGKILKSYNNEKSY